MENSFHTGCVGYLRTGTNLYRQCIDMDCFLMREGIEAYEEGNRIAKENGMTVDCKYYKHSKIILDGLTVGNHQFLLPIKGSSKAKKFEHGMWCDGSF